MAGDDRLSDLHHPAAHPTRVRADHLEGLALVDLVTLHENPFATFDHRTPSERPPEILVLGEPTENYLERALQFVVLAVCDVGKDATLRCLPHKVRILGIDHGDHRTGRLF